jgi:hypothetical protein
MYTSELYCDTFMMPIDIPSDNLVKGSVVRQLSLLHMVIRTKD